MHIMKMKIKNRNHKNALLYMQGSCVNRDLCKNNETKDLKFKKTISDVKYWQDINDYGKLGHAPSFNNSKKYED